MINFGFGHAIKVRYQLLLAAMLFTHAAITANAAAVPTVEVPTVDVLIEDTVLADYQKFVAGRSVYDIHDFSTAGARRDVVDMVLVQQAIRMGGLQLNFQLKPSDFSARNPKLLQRGDALVSFDSIWRHAIEKIASDVLISDAVIERGHYVAGLWTSPKNGKALAVRNTADLRQLTAVSSKSYEADWRTLEGLQLKAIRDEYQWNSMAMLVSKGWVDVMLAPFPRQAPFVYKQGHITLVAVHGVKVLLDDSRHFVVSKRHPLGLATYAALQRGLRLLKQQDVINRAYTECGFYNQAVADWILLRPSNP